MRRIVLVDDDPTNFQDNPNNGIPVRAFTGSHRNCTTGQRDATLAAVSELLDELSGVDDVRPLLRERFRLKKTFDVAEQISPNEPTKQWEHVDKVVKMVYL